MEILTDRMRNVGKETKKHETGIDSTLLCPMLTVDYIRRTAVFKISLFTFFLRSGQ